VDGTQCEMSETIKNVYEGDTKGCGEETQRKR